LRALAAAVQAFQGNELAAMGVRGHGEILAFGTQQSAT
jgi:hypothetical protein